MAASNPFLISEDSNNAFKPSGSDNPFISSGNITQDTSNPFSAFMTGPEQLGTDANLAASNPFALMVSDESFSESSRNSVQFGEAITHLTAQQEALAVSPGSGAVSPVPVSDETLHLLLSVTGHMEAASDSLVDHLGLVKTPRHSPPPGSKSASPVLDEEADHDAAFSAVFAQTVEEFSDNENEIQREKSPNILSDSMNVIIENEDSTQIDLWDSEVPLKTKTKDQILSLFNPHCGQSKGVDLLTEIHDDQLTGQPIVGDPVQSDSSPLPVELSEKNIAASNQETNVKSETIALSLSPQPNSPSQPAHNTPVIRTPSDKDSKSIEGITDTDPTLHTASAFMESFKIEIPQAEITPPTPLSPIEPSPFPSTAPSPMDSGTKPIVSSTAVIPPDSIEKIISDQPHKSSETSICTNMSTDSAPLKMCVIKPALPLHPPRPPAPPRRPNPPSSSHTADIPSSASVSEKHFKDTTAATAVGQLISTDDTASEQVGGLALLSTPCGSSSGLASPNPFAPAAGLQVSTGNALTEDSFDAFTKRFEQASCADSGLNSMTDPFSSASAFGDENRGAADTSSGFGDTEGFGESTGFDEFLAMTAPPPPHSTPSHRSSDQDSTDMNIVIRPRQERSDKVPMLPAPPKPTPSPLLTRAAEPVTPSGTNVNPFLSAAADLHLELDSSHHTERDTGAAGDGSQPDTPLFDDDVSQPLEPFPRTTWQVAEFHMYLRQPNKKKITGQRFWKKIFVRLNENGVVQLYHNESDADPFQELPLQACYSVSDISTQQYDHYGKIFTMKLQYIFYKERPGMRPGQVTKAERITKKLGQFAMSAWEGDYDRVKEFASDVRKLGMPVEHAPQISQLVKLGTQTYEDLKLLSSYIEEVLFKVHVSRDRALTYKTEEIQISGVDEVYIEIDSKGVVVRQLARVRLFFLAFLSGMPDVELGINDLRRQGKEVVGRHDIIPVATEEWIRLEDVTFHSIIDQQAFDQTKILKFKPPDGCYIELMRYRIRPPRNRKLPLQTKVKMTVLKHRVEISSEILVPGHISRKMGMIPCEDVVVRIPLPECWVYMFRVEKHFRYGSVKAAHRRQGKVKGIDRILGAVDTLEQTMMEVSSGTAKYERHHRALVWRIPRLPKEGQGAYTNHTFSCKMNLTSFDQMPDTLERHFVVEYTMPHTTVSHTVCRSASLTGGSGDPPEKYVRYLARYECRQELELCHSEQGPAAYTSSAIVETTERPSDCVQRPAPLPMPPSSDSDSNSD